MKERLKPILEVGIIALALYGLNFLAFSKELKEQVRKEQEGRCDWCGKKVKKLQIHHIIPQSMGGSDTRENAVGLCEDCHRHWDKLSFQGIFYGKK
jgi:Restriction endonuclease